MKNLWRGLCLTVFVAGAMTFSQTPAKENKTEPAIAYTVISADSRVEPDGSKRIVGERKRYVKSNGEWRLERYNPQSHESPVLAATDEGVFLKGPGHLDRKFVSNQADQQMQECFRSAHCLRNQLSFVRIDEVAGLKVYVLRTNMENSAYPIEWIEESYSPKTGYIPLRIIKHFRDGSEMIEEAVKVEFENVPEELNEDIKTLPVKKGLDGARDQERDKN